MKDTSPAPSVARPSLFIVHSSLIVFHSPSSFILHLSSF
jgi:hypothetical protein